jgi:ADP-heptose:LPS heptosyltransferase
MEASKFVRERSINLAGKLSIFEVAALLGKCHFMLGNDSGIGHIAMAVGTRSLRIFGMSDYWGFRSLSDRHIDVFKNISCSPCLQLGMLKPYNVHNCGHKNCMKLITPEEVTETFQTMVQ